MSQGALKTLMLMLAEAPSMAGVSLAFGEEYKRALEYPLPFVVVYPTNGIWNQQLPGYAKNTDTLNLQDVDNLWTTRQAISLVLWAGVDPNANPSPSAVDNAEAVEDLIANVLRALQTQAPNGLYYIPVSGAWQLFNDQVERDGRAYVLTVTVDITYTATPPVEATVDTVVLTPQIEA